MTFKEFRLKQSHCDKHKKLYTFLQVITFFIFFPIAILQLIEDFLEKIINFVAPLRDKIVRFLMYLVIKWEDK